MTCPLCGPTSVPEPFLKDCAPGYASARVALLSYMYRLDTSGAPDVLFMVERLDQIVQVSSS